MITFYPQGSSIKNLSLSLKTSSEKRAIRCRLESHFNKINWKLSCAVFLHRQGSEFHVPEKFRCFNFKNCGRLFGYDNRVMPQKVHNCFVKKVLYQGILCKRTVCCELALTVSLSRVKSNTLFLSLGFSSNVVIDLLNAKEEKGMSGALTLNQVKKLRKIQPNKLTLLAESLQLVLTSFCLE